ELLARVQRGQFPAPRLLSERIAAPLEAICLKAMALRPKDRYAAPRALAADIEHWLADEPTEAHPDPPSARLRRWARRHKPLVAAAVALLLAAVVALSVSTVLIQQQQQVTLAEKRQAETQRDRADQNFGLAPGGGRLPQQGNGEQAAQGARPPSASQGTVALGAGVLRTICAAGRQRPGPPSSAGPGL